MNEREKLLNYEPIFPLFLMLLPIHIVIQLTYHIVPELPVRLSCY